MSEVSAEEVEVLRKINIASLVCNVPGLLIWIFVLPMVLAKKMWGLMLICFLMITC